MCTCVAWALPELVVAMAGFVALCIANQGMVVHSPERRRCIQLPYPSESPSSATRKKKKQKLPEIKWEWVPRRSVSWEDGVDPGSAPASCQRDHAQRSLVRSMPLIASWQKQLEQSRARRVSVELSRVEKELEAMKERSEEQLKASEKARQDEQRKNRHVRFADVDDVAPSDGQAAATNEQKQDAEAKSETPAEGGGENGDPISEEELEAQRLRHAALQAAWDAFPSPELVVYRSALPSAAELSHHDPSFTSRVKQERLSTCILERERAAVTRLCVLRVIALVSRTLTSRYVVGTGSCACRVLVIGALCVFVWKQALATRRRRPERVAAPHHPRLWL